MQFIWYALPNRRFRQTLHRETGAMTVAGIEIIVSHFRGNSNY